MEIVDCEKKYWEFVRELRNDVRVIDGFIQTNHITSEDQENYMSKFSKFFRIVLLDNKPVGFIGVIDDDIRVCTHPDFQNMGVGKFMVKKIKEIWPNAFAKIKKDNMKSIKLFESCGFKLKYLIYDTNET